MARKSNKGNSNRGQKSSAARRPPTNRQYPRTARLNTLLHEIVAEYFERNDDDRFDLITITGVEVDADLNKAQVFISTLSSLLGGEPSASDDESSDEELLEAVAEHRKPVQAMIGRQARMRKTPEVVFALDPSVRSGARIEEILSTLETSTVTSTEFSASSEPVPTAATSAAGVVDNSDDELGEFDGL